MNKTTYKKVLLALSLLMLAMSLKSEESSLSAPLPEITIEEEGKPPQKFGGEENTNSQTNRAVEPKPTATAIAIATATNAITEEIKNPISQTTVKKNQELEIDISEEKTPTNPPSTPPKTIVSGLSNSISFPTTSSKPVVQNTNLGSNSSPASPKNPNPIAETELKIVENPTVLATTTETNTETNTTASTIVNSNSSSTNLIPAVTVTASTTTNTNAVTITTDTPNPPAPIISPAKIPGQNIDIVYQPEPPKIKKDPALKNLLTSSIPTSNDIDTLIEKLKKDAAGKGIAKGTLVPNQLQDEINYDNVPFLTALRTLAEQSGFNFVEPVLPKEEPPVSLRFQKITPLEAFNRLVHSRKYEVVTENGYTTIRVEKLVIKSYKLRFAQPKWVIQEIANLLEITVKTPGNTISSYPIPNTEATSSYGSSGGGGGGGGGGGAGGGGAGGGGQNIGLPTAPRWTPSLPFDEPAYSSQGEAGTSEKNYIFIDRAANGIVIKTSKEKHRMVEAFLKEADKPEPQIMIETRVVEVQLDDALNYGVNWAGVFGTGVSVTAIVGGTGINSLSGILSSGNYILTPQKLTATLNAFQTYGKASYINMPRTYTRSGVPVDISSINTASYQSYQSQTGGSNASIPSVINTFTTGMTIDVVPQLLDNGMVDININPSVAESSMQGAGSAGGGEGVNTNSSNTNSLPVISSQNLTASATVPNGMTVMLGGLVHVKKIDVNTGIPILDKIPFLGKTVFGNTTKTDKKTMLIFFVTPKVVYPDQYQKVYTTQDTWMAINHGNKSDFSTETDDIPKEIVIKHAKRVKDTLQQPRPRINPKKKQRTQNNSSAD